MEVDKPSWGSNFLCPQQCQETSGRHAYSQVHQWLLADIAIALTFSAVGLPHHAPNPCTLPSTQPWQGLPSFPVLPAGTHPTHVASQNIARKTLAAMAGELYIVLDVHYDPKIYG